VTGGASPHLPTIPFRVEQKDFSQLIDNNIPRKLRGRLRLDDINLSDPTKEYGP
jgi:hypothetical protein